MLPVFLANVEYRDGAAVTAAANFWLRDATGLRPHGSSSIRWVPWADGGFNLESTCRRYAASKSGSASPGASAPDVWNAFCLECDAATLNGDEAAVFLVTAVQLDAVLTRGGSMGLKWRHSRGHFGMKYTAQAPGSDQPSIGDFWQYLGGALGAVDMADPATK